MTTKARIKAKSRTNAASSSVSDFIKRLGSSRKGAIARVNSNQLINFKGERK